MKRTAAEEMVELEAQVIEAGLQAQTTSLELLLAEMRALAALLPGQGDEPRSDAEIESGFDNMPI